MFILCWFLGAQISAKSYKMFEKLTQSGYLGTSLVVSTSHTEHPLSTTQAENLYQQQLPSAAESFPVVSEDESREKNLGRDHQQQVVEREFVRLVRVEEEDENSESETEKNTINESVKVHYYHNKAFFLHNNHNNRYQERNSSKNHYLNKKNNNTAGERTLPLRNSFPVRHKEAAAASSCPSNCSNNNVRSEKNSGTRKPSTSSVARDNSLGKTSILWYLRRLSMEAPQESSSDLHRKRDENNDIGNDGDDQPKDSLEDAQVRGTKSTGVGGRRIEDEDDDDEEEDEEDVDEGLSREDLIRFLLANSSGRQNYQQNFHYQQLQQQLLLQQQHLGNAGNFQFGVSASSSVHGAVGGAGLEPIMDASFQDDFDDIHSDYQWFTESGFETDGVGCGEPVVGVPEYPVSLLGEASHHHHGNADFDATMAQIDIEDFHSEDILLRLPPLCASDLQQGETIASITGSILQHLEFEDSMTPSVEEDQNAQSMDMSICKSENLFSPMNENQEALPLSTFSTDSLDTRAGEILATCMTNRNNYTIAFQGMEESSTSSTYKTAPGEVSSPSSDIMENDSGMMTNWRQVTSNNSTGSQRGSVDNNNGSNESSTGGNTGSGTSNNNNSTTSRTSTSSWTTKRSLMTQSCPHPPRNNNMMITANNLGLLRTNPAAAIKLFDIQNVQTVQLAQIYQRHVAARQHKQQLLAGSMTDSGSLTNNNSNNNNNNTASISPAANNIALMMTSGSGSSLSSGRHNTPQILEESWNNNRNPTMIPPTTPTHHHHHNHHHYYGKYNRSRRHSSSTSTSSSSQPTTTQLADAVRKLRSIEIQTSISLVTPSHLHQKLYSASTTPSNDTPGESNVSSTQKSSQVSQSHHLYHQQAASTTHSHQPPPVYICYPSYTLPDLRFLEQHRPKNPVILMPQRYKTTSGKGVNRTQTSMQCPGSNGGGGIHNGAIHQYNNIPRGRRPLSCNDIEDLRSRDLSHVKDWPSLNFLLPKEYQAILAEIKPPEKREQRDDSEKETADIKEESCSQNYNGGNAANNNAGAACSKTEDTAGSGIGSAAAAAALAAAGESPVILRKRINGGARAHPSKRYSMNDAAGFLGQFQQGAGVGVGINRNRNGLAEKFKRFSLQETLPEVAEITSEIAKNLEQLESLALTATTGVVGSHHNEHSHHHHHHQHHHHNTHHFDDTIVESLQANNNNTAFDNNIPSFTGGISSSEESTTSSSNLHPHHHKRVPTNTPKQTSFVDFDNHFQLRNHAFFDDGGAAAAARIIAHVAPMCPGTTASRSGQHLQKAAIDMAQKQSLTDAVAAAVNQIHSVWETTQAVKNVTGSGSSNSGGPNSSFGGGDNKNRLTPTSDTAGNFAAQCMGSPHKSLQQSIMSQTPAGKVVLDSLCPALYSLLSDGLCPFLDTIFGRVPNTVWRVVEASIQYGPTAQSLNELVLRINSEELLAEGPMKFNAFICGLLNLRNLGSWMTFLRTKERLLRTHYEPDAFMYLCNTTTRFLYDQMLVNMHLLSKTPFPAFQLDIFHETKLLHQSMNPVTPTKSLPASLPVSRKNSVKGSTRYNSSGTASSGSTPRKSTSADARPAKTQSKNSKYHANQLKKSQMKRSFSDERPKTSRVAPSTIPKSKTAQNITHDRTQHQQHHTNTGIAGPNSTLNTRLLSRFPSRPKLSNYSRGSAEHHGSTAHHHVSVDDDGREKGMSEPTKAQRPKSFDGSHLTNVAAGGGVAGIIHKGHSPDSNKESDRFRRLQMQWELLSSDESRKGTSPGQSHTSSTSNTTAPSLAGSKIPRPINSPTRANITTHLGNVRPSTGHPSKR